LKGFILVLSILVVVGCSPPGPREDPPNGLFESGVSTGKLDLAIDEASGLVASRTNPGLMWCHNDSRNSSDVYLIDGNAEIKMTCRLPVPNRDWEDIAIGHGKDPDKWYIYLGDIGDNLSTYSTKFVYVFEEPTAGPASLTLASVDTLKIQLEGGARDTETLMIDPMNNDLIIISKWETPVKMFRVSYPFGKGVLTARQTLEINVPEMTAGDISPDGKEVLVKSYNKIYYWRRTDETPLEKLLASPALILPYEPEFQGEAIAWALDGKGYYTVSESRANRRAHLMYYKRVE
jgi:hypothetical protein